MRVRVQWWDAREPLPLPDVADGRVVVCNPPFHHGQQVDWAIPRAMVAATVKTVGTQGRLGGGESWLSVRAMV